MQTIKRAFALFGAVIMLAGGVVDFCEKDYQMAMLDMLMCDVFLRDLRDMMRV